MAFSAALADRIRSVLKGRPRLEEKKMFGGIGFMFNGNLCVGVMKDSLIVRFDPDRAAEVMAEPHVTEFDFTGRAMKGWAVVGPEGVDSDADLRAWIDRAAAFVDTLPAK